MCGIFGFVESVSLRDDRSLERAVRALKHRGPDGDGTFDEASGDLRCGLAHTRLAILDRSDSGRQPMTSRDGRYVIVFNGEIYNFREVRPRLEAAGIELRSQSDTEVVIEAFARFGERSLEWLRGMFAFAIWDKRERSLFLARDRMGVKPLYFSRAGGRFAFASEVRALLDAADVPRVLGGPGLASFLAFGSASEPSTILRDVEMLPPGAYAYVRGGDFTVRRYWELALRTPEKRSFAGAVAETRGLVQEAVALRLVSDVPVGIFLSGGVDSSAIVAVASKATTRPLRTFTVSFDEGAFDEARYAETIAQRFGTEHHVVRLAPAVALSQIESSMSALDQPSADGTNTYVVSKAVRDTGTVVALSGIGGDELFAGYSSFRRFRLALRAQSMLPRGAARAFGNFALARWPQMPVSFRKTATMAMRGGDPFATYGDLRGMFSAEQARALIGGDAIDQAVPPNDVARRVTAWMQSGEGDPINAFAALELSHYLRNTLLRDSDAMGMAHGLEIREPLLDHVLIERVLAIPGRLKLRAGSNKRLLVEAVPELPQNIGRRRKMGFTLPLDAWLRGPLRSWAEERLLGAGSAPAVFDRRAIETTWRDYLAGSRATSWSRVWTLIALFDWCARHRVSA